MLSSQTQVLLQCCYLTSCNCIHASTYAVAHDASESCIALLQIHLYVSHSMDDSMLLVRRQVFPWRHKAAAHLEPA